MDCIDLFKRAAVALQTDHRYLALDQARKMNDPMRSASRSATTPASPS